jgi:hypothetical protein
MHERLNQTALAEHLVVKDLADSLKVLDQQLLQDVRSLSADHQARRDLARKIRRSLGGPAQPLRARKIVVSSPMAVESRQCR